MILWLTLCNQMLSNVTDHQLVRLIIVWCKFECLEAIGRGMLEEVG